MAPHLGALLMASKVQLSFAEDFFDQIGALDGADYKRVMTAVDELRSNPDSPGLDQGFEGR